MDFLKGKHRLGLFLFLLAVLAVGTLAAIRSVTGTGAFLTTEGDWQTLAGDYRIGTIDYTVEINDEILLGRGGSSESLQAYRLAVPILGGVKMFDESVTEALRTKEFNEGATLMRVRVINYSKNMVDVTAQFSLLEQTSGVPPIRVLPLPITLNRTTAANFDSRKHVLDTLGNPADLEALESAYALYLDKLDGTADGITGMMGLELGLLPGATNVDPNLGEDRVIQDGSTWRYYKDVFLVVWSEYGAGEFNAATTAGATGGNPRQARFSAAFTVGQLD